MPRFLNATQARGEIEGILTKAKANIIMISPYIKIHEDLIARLTDAGNRRHVKIVVICREKDLRDEERRKVEQIPNLSLRFNERVHAKCYYNEESMVIASLNLYDSSQGDNHEMGILLSGKEDQDTGAFRDAIMEAEYIIGESTPTAGRAPVTNRPNHFRRAPDDKKEPAETSIVGDIARFLGFGDDKGYCIKCKTRIAVNREAPYCPDCYRVWAKYKNPDHEADVCHSCGKSAKTSMNRPQCSACYAKQKGS
jgi:hypothetical protein